MIKLIARLRLDSLRRSFVNDLYILKSFFVRLPTYFSSSTSYDLIDSMIESASSLPSLSIRRFRRSE